MEKCLPAAFFQNPNGAEPVREWLRELSMMDRKTIGTDIAEVEFTWPRGMPLCRPMDGGLWELRSNLAGGRIARVLFAATRGRMVLLHGFIKKTRKTPAADLQLARRRMKDITT